jgi:LPS O-antigen subunit length determinant protein (WzzB/FepE family)
MIKQHHMITIALGSGLIFLMVAGASNFLAVQQHIVKAQSTPPAANTTSGVNFTAPTGLPGKPLANTTVTQHLPNFNPPITQHCGNKYTSCG